MISLASDDSLLVLDDFGFAAALMVCSAIALGLLLRYARFRGHGVIAYLLLVGAANTLWWTLPAIILCSARADVLHSSQSLGVPLLLIGAALLLTPALVLRSRNPRFRTPGSIPGIPLALALVGLQSVPTCLYLPEVRRVHPSFERTQLQQLLQRVDDRVAFVFVNPDDAGVYLRSVHSLDATKVAQAPPITPSTWLAARPWTDRVGLSVHESPGGWTNVVDRFCSRAALPLPSPQATPSRRSVYSLGMFKPFTNLFLEESGTCSVLRVGAPSSNTFDDMGAVYPWFRTRATPATWIAETIFVVGIADDMYIVDAQARTYAWLGRGRSPVVIEGRALKTPD
jgi:hypothetical protein